MGRRRKRLRRTVQKPESDQQILTPQLRRQIYSAGYAAAQQSFEQDQKRIAHERLQYQRQRMELLRAQQALMRQKISEGFTQSQLDAAVQRAYQQGFSAGQQLVSKPTVDKQQLMDKVYDECRVIEESNPTMKPAITALRHRLKKV